jgi:hypothetical protein
MNSINDLNGVTFGHYTFGSVASAPKASGLGYYTNNGGGYTDVNTTLTAPNSTGVIGSVAFVTGGTTGTLYDGGVVHKAVQYYYGGSGYMKPTATTFGTFGYINIDPMGHGYDTKYYIHGFSAHALLLSTDPTLTKGDFNGTSSTPADPQYFEVLATYDLSVGPGFAYFPTYPTGVNGGSKTKTWLHDSGGMKHIFELDTGLGPHGHYASTTGYNVPGAYVLTGSGQQLNHNSPAYPINFSNQVTNFQVPCYAEGTRILTTRGEVAVEELEAGDEAVLESGATRPVIWIGSRKVRCTGRPGGQDVRPVRVRQGAFGEGLPRRDLVVSPGHAIFVDGRLVPAACLLNGATIVQDDVESVRYFHVELDAHDVLLAEGLSCESYLDDGNRQAFANHFGPVGLFERLDTQNWDDACAPVMTDPYELEAVRSRLVARAEALGWRRVTEPALQVLADGAPVAPLHASGQRWWFLIPPARELVLASAADVLGDLRPELHDRRRLGVAVSELRLNGARLDLGGEHCQAGFYPLESREGLAWRWTDGRAHLAAPTAQPAVLEVEIVMVAPTWERPAARLVLAA